MHILDVVAGLAFLGTVCPSDWLLGGTIMLLDLLKIFSDLDIMHAIIMPYNSTYHTKMSFIHFPVSLKPILHNPRYQQLFLIYLSFLIWHTADAY